MSVPVRQIRAVFDAESITVYQAYNDEIADAALSAGRFVEPFKLTRMTWMKPSFLWMMYRSGWASKAGQERVLAIRMTRTGFETALSLSCLSHFDSDVHADHDTWRRLLQDAPVRIQWDPERTLDGEPLPYRSLQIGLSGPALRNYINEWTIDLEDITDSLERRRGGGDALPPERPYPLPPSIAAQIQATG